MCISWCLLNMSCVLIFLFVLRLCACMLIVLLFVLILQLPFVPFSQHINKHGIELNLIVK
jgi:hypothetical protein